MPSSTSSAASPDTKNTPVEAADAVAHIGEIKLIHVTSRQVASSCFVLDGVYNIVSRDAVTGTPGLALTPSDSDVLQGWVKATRDATQSAQRVKQATDGLDLTTHVVKCKVTYISGSFEFTDNHTHRRETGHHGTAYCWIDRI